MPRHVALLRGVSPMNAKMPDLKRCFEAAGFDNVRTVLATGNVAFDTRSTRPDLLERKIEAALQKDLGRGFGTIVRSSAYLQELIDRDPFAEFKLPAEAKRVVTFLRKPPARKPELPIEQEGARILKLEGSEVFTAYVPLGTKAVFMTLIEKAFGKEVTTRTLDTVRKCAAA